MYYDEILHDSEKDVLELQHRHNAKMSDLHAALINGDNALIEKARENVIFVYEDLIDSIIENTLIKMNPHLYEHNY